jgi:hypothetical protein
MQLQEGPLSHLPCFVTLCPHADLGFKPQTGPILVVCLTNHALDSFLEGLLDVGIESIIRVGSALKTSERLKPYNLSEVGEQVSS